MSVQWYFGEQGRQQGPVAEEELRAMMVSGQVGAQTMVWREGMAGWQPISACPELSGAGPWMSGYGVAVAPAPGVAIASLVCGIVSLFLCYVHAVAAIPAVICGHMAIKRIRESAVPTGGRGLAVAGLVTGYLGILAQVATIVFVGFFFFAMFKAGSASGFPSPAPVTVSPAGPAMPSTTAIPVVEEGTPPEVPETGAGESGLGGEGDDIPAEDP